MSKAPIWHVATDALIADTTHLDTLEFGAYTKLMLAQWRNNGNPLPNNPKRLALMMGVTQAQFRRIWPAISDFFEVTETTISQQRIAKDFKNVIEKIEKNKQNGKLGGKAKSLKIKEQGLANASYPPKQNSTIPEPEPEVLKDTPIGVSKKRRKIDDVFKADWSLPDEYREYANSKGLKDSDDEWEHFFDFWKSEGACKLDWLATWRNRVRKAVKRQGNNPQGYNRPSQSSGDTTVTGARMALDRRRTQDGKVRQPAEAHDYG